MDINITASPSDFLRIFINGNLAGEVSARQLTTLAHMEGELARARTILHMPDILAAFVAECRRIDRIGDDGKNADQKASGFFKGLLAGLDGLLIPHPAGTSIPGFRPSEGIAYDRGYEFGECLKRLLDATKEKVAPEQKTSLVA